MKSRIPGKSERAINMENHESEALFPDRLQVCDRLHELADEEYRAFHSRLCPGTEGILGVRTPVLRQYAMELIRKYGRQAVCSMYTLWQPENDENKRHDENEQSDRNQPFYYYEEKMLTGMLVGLWNPPDPGALEQKLKQFLPLIDNWAVCDTTCSGLKYIGKHQDYFYPVLRSWLESGETYTVRFAVVLLMDYYAQEKYLSELLSLYEQIHHEDYYVKMAVAWAYSVLLVKFYDPVFAFLKTCSLDPVTFRKTIQKACESKRISGEHKMELRRLKEVREMNMFQTAVILAGGHSSRMGFDKQLLEKDHKHLAVYLSEELLKLFREVIIVTNTPELYEGVPVRTCSDIYPGQGPVSGMHSAFCHCDSDYIFVLACDMTGFSPEYALCQARRIKEEGTEACVTLRGEKMEPFHGFYSRSLLPDMEQKLKERKTSIFRLLMKHRITAIAEEEMCRFADPEQLFQNLNTPEEYRKFQNGVK